MIDPPSSRRDRFSAVLGLSLIAHAAVVLAFLVSLPEPSPSAPAEESVAIEIVAEPEKPERLEAPDRVEKPPEPSSQAASPAPPLPKPADEAPKTAEAPKPSAPPETGETTEKTERPSAPPVPFEASADTPPEEPPAPVTLPDSGAEAPDAKTPPAEPSPPAETDAGALSEAPEAKPPQSTPPQLTPTEPNPTEPPAAETPVVPNAPSPEPPSPGSPSPGPSTLRPGDPAALQPETGKMPANEAAPPKLPAEEPPPAETQASVTKPDILTSGPATADGDPAGSAPEAAPKPAVSETANGRPDIPNGSDTPITPTEQAAFVPTTPAVPATKPSAADRTTSPPSGAPSPKPVKALYAKDMLADPRVRGALSKLPPERRIVQICSMEAAEQARHSGRLVPELLKGFGKTGGLITGTHLSARGGAVRAGNAWYELTFDCTVNAEYDTITAFRFALGGAVPRSEWASRGLLLD